MKKKNKNRKKGLVFRICLSSQLTTARPLWRGGLGGGDALERRVRGAGVRRRGLCGAVGLDNLSAHNLKSILHRGTFSSKRTRTLTFENF